MTSADLCFIELDDGLGRYVSGAGVEEIRFIHGEIFRDNCYLREGITLPYDRPCATCSSRTGSP